MAVFTDMVTTSDVQEDDEILLRQGLTDKRINFDLADTIAWGTREGAVYLGDHVANSVYDTVNSFRLFNNQTYFVKVGVTLPYTTTSSNPLLDSNLTNMSYTDYKRTVDATRYVGSTILSFDSTNPEDLYPWQSWSLISGDASIRLGDGNTQTKTSSGDNEPTVPLALHSHSMNHNHSSITTSENTHLHTYAKSANIKAQVEVSAEYGEYEIPTDSYSDPIRTGGAEGVRQGTYFKNETTNTNSVSHTHSVDLPDYSGSTGNTGDNSPTLDVRGESIKMNLWVRTA